MFNYKLSNCLQQYLKSNVKTYKLELFWVIRITDGNKKSINFDPIFGLWSTGWENGFNCQFIFGLKLKNHSIFRCFCGISNKDIPPATSHESPWKPLWCEVVGGCLECREVLILTLSPAAFSTIQQCIKETGYNYWTGPRTGLNTNRPSGKLDALLKSDLFLINDFSTTKSASQGLHTSRPLTRWRSRPLWRTCWGGCSLRRGSGPVQCSCVPVAAWPGCSCRWCQSVPSPPQSSSWVADCKIYIFFLIKIMLHRIK